MPNQIVLAWTVDVSNSPFGPAQAAAALSAIELYQDGTTDPVLGQFFGLTVASDATTTPTATTAKRTLTLNMSASGTPPPFPCRPRTSTPPVLPYPLREAVSLNGSFFPQNGSMLVASSFSQIPSLVPGESIQFLSQEGVFYTVSAVGPTGIGITAPYTGTTKNTGAFKEIAAPITRAAIFSTSNMDRSSIATTPAIAAGPGARTVVLTYMDSTGGGPFVTSALLTGRRPAPFALAGGSRDIAQINNLVILAAGSFANNVGQLTLVAMSETISTTVEPGVTPKEYYGPLTDEAQMLIARPLVYLPPSYFSLAQQSASAPQLSGDFTVTTGSKNVPTTVDQTSALSAGNSIEFASQPGTIYTVAAVTAKAVALTTAYSGIDDSGTGQGNNANTGTRGNLGKEVISKKTGATNLSSAGAVPTNAQLCAPLAEYLQTGVAEPPPNPPLSPAFFAPPTFLSGLYTKTIQKALAVPVTPSAIALL